MTSGESQVQIRTVAAADIPNVARVQLRSALAAFADIFPPAIPKPTQPELELEWAALVANPDRSVLAAVLDGEIVAAIAFGSDDEADKGTDCILLKLYVVPEHLGQGIGSLLYDRAIGDLRQQGYKRARLWVLEDNTWARNMYERRGWLPRPWVRSDWPGSGVNEIGFVLDLS